jgi:hypothetical protein
LGLTAGRPTAFQAASDAVHQFGRDQVMTDKSNLLCGALLTAAIEASSAAGRDTSSVRPAWERYWAADNPDHSHQRNQAFASTWKALRQGLGREMHRRWLLADLAAGWALIAIISWDLATKPAFTPLSIGRH